MKVYKKNTCHYCFCHLKYSLAMKCKKCGSQVSESLSNCPTCNTFLGYPNVREAMNREESSALEKRYVDAYAKSKSMAADQSLKKFEEAMGKTSAVVNLDIDDLKFFFFSDKTLYSNYHLWVKGESRKPAMEEDDKMRRAVDAKLFGGYAEHIRFAALSLDGKGLESYGLFAMRLKDAAIDERATLLEDNSYHFMEKHGVKITGGIPLGHKAAWKDRHKLAAVKLSDKISSGTTEGDYAKILLSSSGKRSDDEFIEVHIFGGFDNQAVESVRGDSSKFSKVALAMIECVKEYMQKSKTEWVEG